jgi:hypothetical protein
MFALSMLIPTLESITLSKTLESTHYFTTRNSLIELAYEPLAFLINGIIKKIPPIQAPNIPLVTVIIPITSFWWLINKVSDSIGGKPNTRKISRFYKYIQKCKILFPYLLKSLLIHNLIIYAYLIGIVWNRTFIDCMGELSNTTSYQTTLIELSPTWNIVYTKAPTINFDFPCVMHDINQVEQYSKKTISSNVILDDQKHDLRIQNITDRLLTFYFVGMWMLPSEILELVTAKLAYSTENLNSRYEINKKFSFKAFDSTHITKSLKSGTLNKDSYRLLQVATFGNKRPGLENLLFRAQLFSLAYIQESSALLSMISKNAISDTDCTLLLMVFKDNVIAPIMQWLGTILPFTLGNNYSTLVFIGLVEYYDLDIHTISLTTLMMLTLSLGMFISLLLDWSLSIVIQLFTLFPFPGRLGPGKRIFLE